jgi:LmbE family N-acetylglucosaminyl deacetylase
VRGGELRSVKALAISIGSTLAMIRILLLGSLLTVAPALAAQQTVPPPRADLCTQCDTDVLRVLLIGAHPDDEDTNLIAWLERGNRAATAYLSLTRGDGGQNLIGNELGEELGIIRTEELLAARRVDGAHQFFTRAFDFGFSKSAAETYAHWPRDSLLGDVVKVVRSWQPHIIITMFSGTPRDGHGQHQVSALLGKEAYALAGDTLRFPVASFGRAWTPLKLYQTARFQPDSATLRINVGEYNPELFRSYAEIAGESRSQHKSQGFGALQRKGVVWNYITRLDTRVNQNTPAGSEQSLFEGIVQARVDTARGASSPDFMKHVALEAISDRQYVALGDSALVRLTFYNRSREPLQLNPGNTPGLSHDFPRGQIVLVAPDSAFQWLAYMKGRELSQPWWLAEPRRGDLFTPPVPVLSLTSNWRQTPEDEREIRGWARVLVTSPALPARMHEERTPIAFRFVDPVRGDVQRPVAVVPAISVALDNPIELARANAPIDRFINVTIRAAVMKPELVRVALTLPAGLASDSASRTITVDSAGTRRITFRIRGQLAAGDHTIAASATADGRAYTSGYTPIDYDHITPQRIFRPSSVRIRAVDLRVPAGTNIAYVQGVGDNVAHSLQQLGIPVTVVSPRDIPTVDLARFSAVVVGPRAYDANRELIDNNTYLLDYARNGGTLVVQYGQYEMMRPGVMPYPITIARPHDRVTEEVAPVRVIDSSAPALNSPNRISQSDFEGWVQERSLYMPRSFDEHYRPVLEMNDPGAPANRGGILIAPYGKGLYVYTTLAFFRQLPAGVSGASKLFVNLISQRAPRQ